MGTIAELAVILPLLVTATFTEDQSALTDANLPKLHPLKLPEPSALPEHNFNEDPPPGDDRQSASETSFSNFNITRLDEIVEDTRRKFSDTDANDLFVNDPAVGDYFDDIAAAAGILETAINARSKGLSKDDYYKYFDVVRAIDKMFEDSSSKTDDQPAPLGLRECRLLPDQLKNFTIAPIVGLTLNTLTASRIQGYKWYDNVTLRTACATPNIENNLKTLAALMGENCGEGVGRNDSVEEAMQDAMEQYAREDHFEGVDDENRCLHMFVARYTNSTDAVTKFMMSFDKYYLASLDNNIPWACDYRSEELNANASAASEDIKSTIQWTAYFLGNKSAEEYVNTTFEMVDALRSADKSTSEWLQGASTPREIELRKRTRSSVMDLMADLLKYVTQAYRQLPKPFGLKKDVLWPEDVYYFEAADTSLSNMFEYFGYAVEDARGEADAGNNYPIDGSVSRHCEYVETEKILKRVIEPMMGGCETNVDEGPDDEDKELVPKLMTYAMAHGFDGCEDNKCLQVFIARYTDYEPDYLAKLKNSVDKYTLLWVVLQSFCASSVEDPARKEDVWRKTVELVGSVKKAMIVLSNLSSKADIYKPCAAGFQDWTADVEAIATSVVGNAASSINASSWQARQAVHELVAKGIVAKLDGSTYEDGYRFKALAYLPFADDGQHGFLSVPVGAEDMLRNESKLVKYAVSRYRKRDVQSLARLQEKWEAIERKGRVILDATFSTSASNLSKRVEEVENRFEKDIGGAFLSAGGFKALIALRCGYEFVWYELGYRYFPAGSATEGYVLATEQDNKYKYNCGQLVFFP